MQLRRARPDDAEPIERIRIRGWQIGYRHVFPPEELDKLTVDWSRWRMQLDDPTWAQHCAVAEDDAGVIGWVTYGPSTSPEGLGVIYGLYVDPDHWDKGAGRALLGYAEEELTRLWDDAFLWTLAENPRTRRFYETAGWRADGTTGTFERLGVSAPTVRYAKRLNSSTSRS